MDFLNIANLPECRCDGLMDCTYIFDIWPYFLNYRLRRHLFYLLDYVTTSEKFQIGDREKNKNKNWLGEMYRYVL